VTEMDIEARVWNIFMFATMLGILVITAGGKIDLFVAGLILIITGGVTLFASSFLEGKEVKDDGKGTG